MLGFSDLDVRLIKEGKERCLWMLLADFKRGAIVVPKGFYTDFASIPRSALTHDFMGKFNEEACIHDYLYRKDSYPTVERWVADALLYRMLKECGRYSDDFCWEVYIAVRAGGGDSFHKYNVADIPDVID